MTRLITHIFKTTITLLQDWRVNTGRAEKDGGLTSNSTISKVTETLFNMEGENLLQKRREKSLTNTQDTLKTILSEFILTFSAFKVQYSSPHLGPFWYSHQHVLLLWYSESPQPPSSHTLQWLKSKQHTLEPGYWIKPLITDFLHWLEKNSWDLTLILAHPQNGSIPTCHSTRLVMCLLLRLWPKPLNSKRQVQVKGLQLHTITGHL